MPCVLIKGQALLGSILFPAVVALPLYCSIGVENNLFAVSRSLFDPFGYIAYVPLTRPSRLSLAGQVSY